MFGVRFALQPKYSGFQVGITESGNGVRVRLPPSAVCSYLPLVGAREA